MSGNFLLDTTAAIARISGQAAILNVLEQADEIFIPAVVLGKLYFEAEKSARVEDNLTKIQQLAAGGLCFRVMQVPPDRMAGLRVK